jgi:hypothetical protein
METNDPTIEQHKASLTGTPWELAPLQIDGTPKAVIALSQTQMDDIITSLYGTMTHDALADWLKTIFYHEFLQADPMLWNVQSNEGEETDPFDMAEAEREKNG